MFCVGIRSCTILAMTYLLWLAAEAVLPHALTRVTGGGHFGSSHAIVNVTVVPASSSGLTEMRSPAWTFAGKVNVPGFETCSTTRSRSGSPNGKVDRAQSEALQRALQFGLSRRDGDGRPRRFSCTGHPMKGFGHPSIFFHLAFGPRGSTVSGRQRNWTVISSLC